MDLCETSDFVQRNGKLLYTRGSVKYASQDKYEGE